MRRGLTSVLVFSLLLGGMQFVHALVPEYRPPWADWVWDSNRNELHDEIDSAARETPDDEITLVVLYDSPPSQSDLDDLRRTTSPSSDYVISALPGILITARAGRISSVPTLQGVNAVDFLTTTDRALALSVKSIKARDSTEYSPNTAWQAFGVSGLGINVGIIDSGVDDAHESLVDKFITGGYFQSITELTCINPTDDQQTQVRHGTGVAGISIGIGGPSQVNRGVAPNAGLFDLKADENVAATIKAFDWAIKWNNQQVSCFHVPFDPIDVINLSSSTSDDCGQSTLSLIIRSAFAAGIVVVHSSGNDGPEQGTIDGPNPDGGIISVGNLDDQNSVTRVADPIFFTSHGNVGSSRGPRCSDNDSETLDELFPTLAAPGTDVTRPNTVNCESPPCPGPCNTCYRAATGSSNSAPHVAGIVGLMLEYKSCLRPNSSTDTRVRDILINATEYRTEVGVGPPPQVSQTGLFGRSWNNAWGYGYADAYEAVRLAGLTSC